MPKHIHKFYKQPTEGKSKYMWKCTDCPWFVHAGLEHVIIGKSAYCWSCDGVFEMTSSSLLEDKPQCLGCTGVEDLDEYMKERIEARRRADGIEVIEPDNPTEEGEE